MSADQGEAPAGATVAGAADHEARSPALVLRDFVADHADYGLALALALLLLAPDSTYLIVEQLDAMRVAVLVAAIPLVVALSRARPSLRITDILLAAFLVVAAAGWVLGASAENPRLFVAVLLPFAFYLLGRVSGASYPFPLIAWTLAGCGAVGALFVLIEYIAVGEPLFVDASTYYWNPVNGLLFRPGGLYGSPPGAALIFSMTAFAALWLVLTARGRIRWVAIGALVVIAAGLVVTFARGSYVGFVVGLIGFLMLTLPRPLVRRALLVAAVAAALFVVSLPLWISSDVFQEGLLRPSTFDYRLGNWELVFDALNSPLQVAFGEGFNALLLARTEYGAIPASTDLTLESLLVSDGPHNQFLLVLLELGLLGVALLLAWFAAAIISGVRGALTAVDRSRRILLASLSMAVLSYAVACVFGDHLRYDTSVAIVAVLAGLVISLADNSRHLEQPAVTGAEGR